MVKALYDDSQNSMTEDNEITVPFPAMTGVKPGCCMSVFLFLLIIDWVMQQTVKEERTRIHHLEDLDFTDDIVLL